MKRFDVIVIGSGMGGLCTAARLAHNGYRVLVVESLSRIGGRCSTRHLQGFKLTTGVVGIECGGVVERFFDSLGLSFDLHPAGPLACLICGQPVEIPSHEGMKRLLLAAGSNPQDIERLMAAISRGRNWQTPSSDLTLDQWITQYTDDERLVLVFRMLSFAALMASPEEIGVAAFFAFFDKLKQIPRFGYAPEGAIALLAPRGRHLLIALATPPGDTAADDIETEVGICIADLDRLFPGSMADADILAADAFHGDRPAMHAQSGRDAPAKTSIINLYNVGDGAKPPGTTGLPAVVEAADLCARDICKRINLIESATVAA